MSDIKQWHSGRWGQRISWQTLFHGVESFAILGFLSCESEVAQSCPILCYPIDCSLSGSSVHGIFQARVLEWIAVSFSRNRIRVSHIAGRHYTVWAARWAQGKIVSWKSASFTLVPLYKPYQLMFSYQSKCLQFELLSFSTFICL